MRPRWRKVLADLWGNLSRFILVTLSLMVGLFSVGMIIGGYQTTLQDMQSGFEAINPADIMITTEGFDENLIERVSNIDNVSAVSAERLLHIQMQSTHGEWQNMIIRVLPNGDNDVNQVELLSGSMPDDKEIAIDVHREIGYEIGDSLQIQTPSGLIRSFKISGKLRDQSIGVTGTSYFVAPVYGYITLDTLPWLQQEKSFNILLIKTDQNVEGQAYDDLVDEIEGVVQQSGRMIYGINKLKPVSHPNSGYVSAVSGFLGLMGFISVALSGFLVFNAMAALFAQQIQYIGIMKAIGAQRKGIIAMYMAFIFVFGMVALIIAVPLSVWAPAELGNFLAGRMNYLAGGARLVPLSLVIQGLIALILPQMAGFFPIWKASRISVQEAITTTGIKEGNFKKDWLSRKFEKIKGLGRPLLISIRNTFRRKGRVILTLVTLSLGGAVFIATFNVRASLETYIDKVSGYLLADINLDFDRLYRIDEIEEISKTINGVQAVEARGGASAQLLDEKGNNLQNVEILASPSESELIQPILLEGRWLIPGDQNAIVLNEAFLSNFPNLTVGDSITLEINLRKADWVIVGFFQFIGSDYFLAYVPLGYLNQMTGTIGRAANFQVVVDSSIKQSQETDQITNLLDKTFREKGFAIRSASTSQNLLGNATLGLDTLTVFLLIMSGLTALVGSISLTGTMGMNVLERTREIGVMRAIGAADRQVMKLVIVEGLLIGLISWLIAVILAFPISYLMSDIINKAIFGISGEFAFTWTGFLLWLGIVILLSITASIIPARNAARLTIREVLAYE